MIWRRRLRRGESAASDPATPTGVRLGCWLGGEAALPVHGREALLPFADMRRHVLLMGATGAGKTETAMRMAHGVATVGDAPIFYLDAKGDREAAKRFVGLMEAAGRSPRVFPNERFDGWRGDNRAVINRLLEIIQFTEEGPAAYYRDIAKAAVRLACDQSGGPPRSSGEFLSRLDARSLRREHHDAPGARALTVEQVRQVRVRYEAFFGQTGPVLDGGWAWEDVDAAYVMLDSLSLREEAANLARLLFEDFAHYFSNRKSRDQFCVLFVDEFSAIAAQNDMASRVEQARGFNAGLVLAPQVAAGMGSDEQRDRILGSAETTILHRVNTPEEIVSLAGTRRVVEFSHHYEQGTGTRDGSARLQHQFKVDPNQVRGLAAGTAWVIRRGRAMKIRVHRAPEGPIGNLPGPEPAPCVAPSSPSPATRPLPY